MKNIKSVSVAVISLFGVGMIAVTTLNVFATPQPVLSIAPTGTSQFLVTITNGDSSANYEIYSTPVLIDPNYPWVLQEEGLVGQTNFTMNMLSGQNGFFRVAVGIDADGDGVPNYLDGDPNNPAVGALTITIASPLNGSTFN